MKNKGVIQDLKNDNSKKYIQQFLWSCCGQCGDNSVSDSSLFQLILLKIYRPFSTQSVLTTEILICCTRHFQSCSLYLASSVCRSLQCLISALTQGGKSCLLFRLTCSVVLWGGRNTANKHHWRVWGVLSVYGPHWVCPSSWQVHKTQSPLQTVPLQSNLEPEQCRHRKHTRCERGQTQCDPDTASTPHTHQ